ncbi:glycosyltransferase family 2 protein [Pelistega europaea]|uniref:Glycosyltransferase family 2 protein n=1 Tax=Pelistega europaea TaxID=106147 RepID=A0A7Y4LAG3_9BURK|nr:glycosyltransferase family 2 protein [Pelistega europaea]NOL49908.1 glycosyltransferase family 2 protein [Pelistega europaea]
MDNKSSVCAVVVTFNRKNLLLNCLHALKQQTVSVDHIVVVNNASTDGTVDFLISHGWVNDKSFTLLNLPENSGGAGGFHEGIKFAYEHGYDYIWLMDDDGFPQRDCLETLLPFALTENYIGPLVVNSKNPTELTFPLRIPKTATTLNSIQDIQHTQYQSIIPEIVMPFNGILFHKNLIEKIGLPKKEYFIWGDDMEYTWRAQSTQFKIFTVVKAVFFHPKEPSLGSPMFFGKLKFNDTNSPLKLYCMSRNNTRNLLDYRGISHVLLFITKAIWFYLLTRPNLKKLKIVLSGIMAGIKKDFSGHRQFLK